MNYLDYGPKWTHLSWHPCFSFQSSAGVPTCQGPAGPPASGANNECRGPTSLIKKAINKPKEILINLE